MNNSILSDIKKMLGIGDDYEHFDRDIIIHINTVLMLLNQIGIGPKKTFFLSEFYDKTWGEFLGDNLEDLEAVKTFIYIRVRLIFDPPMSSSVAEALKNSAKELEWHLNERAERMRIDREADDGHL